MGTVTTVLGMVDAGQLGHCQMHEHLYVAPTPASQSSPALLIDDETKSLAELINYRGAGGTALLDAQPGGAGRNAAALWRMSAASGVAIIAVTGYHLPMFYHRDHWIFGDDLSALRHRFLGEICEGVEESPAHQRIRAGAVKAAIGAEGATGRLALCLKAAAQAAAQARVPLILHTEKGAGAVEAVSLCEGQGLDPRFIAVCHADRQAQDYRPHEAIARTGAYLEYDTIARPKYHGDGQELALIRHMADRGYVHRLLLSLDTTAARLKSYGGSPGLSYILETFLPALERAGLSQRDIGRIARQNPIALLEGNQTN